MSEPDPPRAAGPDVQLLGVYPTDGEGVGCGVDGPDECGVPIDATLTLRFDRYLDPASVNRQAIRVFTGDPASSPNIPFDVAYDPLERVVEFRMPRGYAFQPRALYHFELVVPQDGDDFGVRAFDGAPLERSFESLRLSFLTARVGEPVAPRDVPSCDEIVTQVLAFPKLGNCASSKCHRAIQNELGAAPEALWLDGRSNLRNTAINRVAHETELGDTAGTPLQDSPRFGVQMPIIAPKSPGNSYLLYKLLRSPLNFEPCAVGISSSVCAGPGDKLVSLYDKVPLPEGMSLEPSPEESLRLREWFVRGEAMPYPNSDSEGVSLQGLRALTAFIAAGADCSE